MKFQVIDRRKTDAAAFVTRKQPLSAKGFLPSSIDEATRSVEVVAATENPATVYDPVRWEVVEEVLLMSGFDAPADGKVPLTVEHERHAGAVIGSFREMRVVNRQLIGRVFFSSSQDAEDFWLKVKEGHLDRFSITYPAKDRDSIYVAEGEESVIEGQRYQGPVLVTKSWTVKALGLVIFGADSEARSRANISLSKEQTVMEITPELRAFLERCGLKKGATDQEAQAFMQRYQVNNGGNGGGSDPVLAERQRIAEIHAMGREFGLDQNFVSGLVTDGVSIDAARAAIMDRIMATSRANDGAVNFRSAGSSPVIMVDERDKFRDAAVDGFAQRAGVKIEQPAPGAELYRNTSLLDLSKECCRASSIRVHNLGPHQVVERALTTTDLPYIMSNVGNKALLAAYQAYPAAAMQLVRIGSVNDFKTAYRIRISEFPTLDEIPEHGNYRYGKLSEAQESFSLSTYGKLFAVTRQAIINDDLNALVTVPRAQAQAAKRLVDSAVISHLIANSAMADGNALFSSAHGNYVASGSGAAPSADTLKAAFLAMRTQTGLEGMVLNIQPRFLLTPAALETPSWQLLESTGDLSDNKNEGVRNPWYRRLELVVHPLLDSTSATGWYVLADPAMYDTIELAYLQGTDGPYLEQQRGWTVDGIEFKVRIDFGVKALDWRAMYFNHGA